MACIFKMSKTHFPAVLVLLRPGLRFGYEPKKALCAFCLAHMLVVGCEGGDLTAAPKMCNEANIFEPEILSNSAGGFVSR